MPIIETDNVVTLRGEGLIVRGPEGYINCILPENLALYINIDAKYKLTFVYIDKEGVGSKSRECSSDDPITANIRITEDFFPNREEYSARKVMFRLDIHIADIQIFKII